MKDQQPVRAKILEMAARLFQSQGYSAMTMSQVLQECGAPKGSLYYYFPQGKEQLAIEAIGLIRQKIEEQIRRYLAKIEDPVEAIQALINATAAELEQPENIIFCTVSLLTLEVSLVSEPLRKACQATNAAWEQAFVEKLEQGGYAPDRAGELGALVQVMIDGAIISSMGRKDTLPLRRAAAAIPTLLKGDI